MSMDIASHSAFNKGNWDYDQLLESDTLCTITEIRLVGVNLNDPNTSRAPTNHWELLLMLPESSEDESQRSEPLILLDMDLVRYGVRKGRVQLASRVGTQIEAMCSQAITVKRNIMVGDIINLISNRNLQYFRFNKNEEGCAHWCAVVLEELARNNIIPDDAVDSAKRTMNYYWGERGRAVYRLYENGSFYEPS